ncbi:MAG: AAA family ATPase [Verrucomicrobiales bacterium]
MSVSTAQDLAHRLASARDTLMKELGRVVYGQEETLRLLTIGLLCRGHVLLLGMPGVGKTLMAATLARALDLEFRRIQFTPDLMPADITGTDIIEEDPATGQRRHHFIQGPLFGNFILADEVNRTTPKTQAALLQAMQEREVSVGRATYTLKPPFFVVATQNPIESEGTYTLPEAQLDRFMFCLKVGYPSHDEECAIVKGTTGTELGDITKVLTRDEILQLQDAVRAVPVADDVVGYAVRLVAATRSDAASHELVQRYVSYGGSPRASQNIILGAKARALLGGRFHVDFADIQAMAAPVLRHRLILNYKARAEQVTADHITDTLIQSIKT